MTTLSRLFHDDTARSSWHSSHSSPQAARCPNKGRLTRTSPSHTIVSSHRTILSHTSSLSQSTKNDQV